MLDNSPLRSTKTLVNAKIPPERDRIELLKRNIARREYAVAVIGLGYVGLPLAARFAEAGFSVVGFDVDRTKI